MASGDTSRDVICQALIQRIAEGDAAALAELYDHTSASVYGLALRILRAPSDAEEVVLDAYHRFWRHASRYDADRGSVFGLLLSITRSCAIDRLRLQARHRVFSDADAVFDPVADAPSPEEILAGGELRETMQAALRDLSPEQREVIEMAFYEGLSHCQLAEKLGLPLGTVKSRIRSGILRLRRFLGENPARER